MKNQATTKVSSSTSLSAGILLGTLLLGTGGSSFSSATSVDRSYNPQSAIINNNLTISLEKDKQQNNSALEFQKLSLQLMEMYGFSIKQYSEIMKVTRATIYKWHDLNTPLKKVQSKNLNRLNILNNSLVGIHSNRKNLLGSWLKTPLDNDVLSTREILESNAINKEDIIELLSKVNLGLKSMEMSNELDELLGIS
ncbi:hypothetical protein H5201_16890 [Pseudoalteromonas sp. SG43-6]|uniref:hypothetical protein n=1 Tax=Pseudoalteromonas sp. SG43-6 TaxID=2760967 RepID=UPI0015FEC932|nr:hypothetical protein [Pseudoalteromonas sp. SG43-6]MBB1435943.1 hypothetical protein [Pseudoalteromonas sp. SG43-6]